MPLETEILLCDCLAGFDDTRHFAVLDERTLTYDVVERRPGGRAHVLRKHVPSLREARTHACSGRSHAGACPRRPERRVEAPDARHLEAPSPAAGADHVDASSPVAGADRVDASSPVSSPAVRRVDATALLAPLAALLGSALADGAARPGSVVRVVDQAGRTVDYELTGSAPPEEDPLPVSVTSPVGRALVGAAPGDWVSLTVANGRRKRVQVVDVLPGSQP